MQHLPRGTDGHWPHDAVRDLLEEPRSDELENGMAVEVMNSRGVVTRGPNGGQQELESAATYEGPRRRCQHGGRALPRC
jgi:hypothetical protein